MNLVPWRKPPEERSESALSMEQWVSMLTSFSYNGLRYTMPGAKQEQIGAGYASLAAAAYKSNGVVFACMLNRMLVFSEARFQFRQRNSAGAGACSGRRRFRRSSSRGRARRPATC
jgi:hypothetical protein